MSPHFESMFLSELSADANAGEIANIVRSSRANNAMNELTGLLLFDGERFCECLEGPEAMVQQTMAKIAVDPRHTQFQPLHNGQMAGKRRFDAWFVGILAPDGPSPLLEFRSLRGPAAIEKLVSFFREGKKRGLHAV